MVTIRVGGQDYVMRSDPNCFTCQSPHRMFIENELIQGRSYSTIAEALSTMTTGLKPRPSKQSIGNHVRADHLPLTAGAQRRLIERRALEIGASYEEGVDDVIDMVTVNQMIVAKGFQRMQRGDIEPDLNDVIAASRMLFQIEQSVGGGLDEQVWRDALMVYMEIAQQFIPQAAWQDYARALTGHPVIKAIAEAEERARTGGDALTA